MKLNRLLLLAISFLGMTSFSVAQDLSEQKPKRKGQLYFTWGYNRDKYSASNITFVNHKTDNYDFKFIHAEAHEKPDMWDFYGPVRLTVPQYDLKMGYYFNDKHDLGIELGWNHLKYVVTDNQIIHVQGEIRGHYLDKDTLVTPSFVHLQHTNGNNYLILSLVKRQSLFVYKNVQASAIAKVGAGPMMSYTISTILGNSDPGYFHYHGMVFASELGFRVAFLKYFFIESDAQVAFADYTNTRLGYDHQGLSRQTFFSLQWTWEGGMIFPIGRKVNR